MDKKSMSIFIIVIALLAGLMVYIFSGPENYNWDVRIVEQGEEPYDVGLFTEVLSKSYGDDFSIIRRSTDFKACTDSADGTMLYLDDNIRLTEDHIDELLNFTERGNTVYFSCGYIPQELIYQSTGVDLDITYEDDFWDTDYVEEDYYYEEDDADEDYDEYDYYNLYLEDSVAQVDFLEPTSGAFDFKYIERDSTFIYTWSGLNRQVFTEYNEDGLFTPVSIINDSIYDCIKFNHGDGEIYIQMNPIMFGNLYFTEKNGFDYANKMTSFFNDGPVFYNKRYYYYDSSGDGEVENIGRSPLDFILDSKSLKWTLYSILLIVLLYVLFSFKRRLPAIAHFSKPKNTTINHIKTLSGFYLSARDHTIIAGEMMNNFKFYLRDRYRLNTNLDKEELTPLISKNSGIPAEHIESIYKEEFKINYSNDSKSRGVVSLYKKLESFYKNCK